MDGHQLTEKGPTHKKTEQGKQQGRNNIPFPVSGLKGLAIGLNFSHPKVAFRALCRVQRHSDQTVRTLLIGAVDGFIAAASACCSLGKHTVPFLCPATMAMKSILPLFQKHLFDLNVTLLPHGSEP